MEERSASKHKVRKLDLTDWGYVSSFMEGEGKKADEIDVPNLLNNKDSIILGYFNKDSDMIGLAGATIRGVYAYGEFLHCDTSRPQYLQMVTLVKLLDSIEKKLRVNLVEKLFIATSNLYEQLQRRGYQIYKDEGIKKTFVKEL